MMNGRGLRLWLGLVLFSSFVIRHSAFGQTGLQLQLVSEQSAIVPGKPFTVGLWIQHDRGWHTYWRFPGIVGVPTQMKWDLPKGWKAGPLVYPEPERTLMFKIKAQGFDRDVMLRTEITPPSTLRVGDQITLTGKASWMCCGNSCHPGSMDLRLTLPVAESSALNEKWHKLLNEERARAEQRSDAWTSSVVETGQTLTLSLKPATPQARVSKNQREAGKIIVFTEDGWFDTDKPQVIQRHDDGSLTITLIKADVYVGGKPPKTLRAILRNDEGWLKDAEWRCLQIEPKIDR
jgi:thiol:disulfide interchange protein DsbD